MIDAEKQIKVREALQKFGNDIPIEEFLDECPEKGTSLKKEYATISSRR